MRPAPWRPFGPHGQRYNTERPGADLGRVASVLAVLTDASAIAGDPQIKDVISRSVSHPTADSGKGGQCPRRRLEGHLVVEKSASGTPKCPCAPTGAGRRAWVLSG